MTTKRVTIRVEWTTENRKGETTRHSREHTTADSKVQKQVDKYRAMIEKRDGYNVDFRFADATDWKVG